MLRSYSLTKVLNRSSEVTMLQPRYKSAHTRTHSVLMTIFPGEPGLAGCPR